MKTNPLYHMKKSLIVANWKSNKTKTEAKNWLEEASRENFPDSLEIVIFPSFTILDFVSSFVKEKGLPFKIGAQDVSPFDDGAYTGEVSARQIKEFAEYVLIGHSERRTNFEESDDMVRNKIERAIAQELKPIICVSKIEQMNNLNFDQIIFAYEPIGSIGTGNPEDSSSVDLTSKEIKSKTNNSQVIYGGSVDVENIREYLGLESISGVLVGGQSLDPANFINILKNAI